MKKILLFTLIVAVFVFMPFEGWAATNSSPDQVVYACYLKSNGLLRTVGDPSECLKSESILSWNMVGQQGPQGPQGEQGPPGEDGQDGANGLNCWDLDGSGTCNGSEDVDGSGSCDAMDCKGPQGNQGEPGTDGKDLTNELCQLYALTGQTPPDTLSCPPSVCPCWDATTIDIYAGLYYMTWSCNYSDEVVAFNGTDADGQTYQYIASLIELAPLPGDFCMTENPTEGQQFHYDLTLDEFSACRELLGSSELWALKCVIH